jgi:hypothetical protein
VVNANDKYFVLVRNRRTGKSLTCSTIGEMFSGNKTLFKDLWISRDKVWDFEAETRPVIRLDMSQVYGETKNNVVDDINYRLKDIATIFDLTNIDFTQSINIILIDIVSELHRKSGKEVVVIIDEYDAPVNKLINNVEELNKVEELLSTFYGILKSLDAHIRLVYITGIMKFSSMSLFSGLNNFKDLTFDMRAGTLVGYTEQELRDNFPHHLEAFRQKLLLNSVDDVVSRLKDKYDGYIYGCDTSNGMLSPRVFNAFGVSRALSNLDIHHNKWYHTGHSSLLVLQEVQKIIDQQALDSAAEDRIISFSELVEKSSVAAIRFDLLMYYAGYATLKAIDKDSEKVTIGCPNTDVRTLLEMDLLKTFFTEAFANREIELCKNIFTSLISNKEAELQTHLRTLIGKIPYYNLNNEAIFHSIITHSLKIGASNNVFFHKMATNLRRINVVVQNPVNRSAFMIEVGHIFNIVYVCCVYSVYTVLLPTTLVTILTCILFRNCIFICSIKTTSQWMTLCHKLRRKSVSRNIL